MVLVQVRSSLESPAKAPILLFLRVLGPIYTKKLQVKMQKFAFWLSA